MGDDIFDWKAKKVQRKDGVIVGCTQSHEWLLPWWWMHFRMHNQYPVTFVDFGDMSEAGRKFCSKRGQLLKLELSAETFVASKTTVKDADKIWQRKELDTWTARLAWFQKPFVCLLSPYKRTVWMDLDCQTRKPIDPIFEYCENPHKIAVTPEPAIVQQFHEQKGIIYYGEMEYNTGVIVFKHGSPIIQEWAKMCFKRNDKIWGDQEALTRMLYENNIEIVQLPPIYNCRAEEQPEP